MFDFLTSIDRSILITLGIFAVALIGPRIGVNKPNEIAFCWGKIPNNYSLKSMWYVRPRLTSVHRGRGVFFTPSRFTGFSEVVKDLTIVLKGTLGEGPGKLRYKATIVADDEIDLIRLAREQDEPFQRLFRREIEIAYTKAFAYAAPFNSVQKLSKLEAEMMGHLNYIGISFRLEFEGSITNTAPVLLNAEIPHAEELETIEGQ